MGILFERQAGVYWAEIREQEENSSEGKFRAVFLHPLDYTGWPVYHHGTYKLEASMENITKTTKNDTRQKILRAAAQIINTKGVLALTLEAVAKEAKISKGGLFYHFATKDDLMKGMNDFIMHNFFDDLERITKDDPRHNGKWTRAYTNLTFNLLDSEFEMNLAFLSAIATSPDLVKSMARDLKVLQNHIENDQINPIVSTVIRLAVDGMYFNQLYGLNLNEDVRDQVLNYLLSLTEEEK
ncbi:TetR/AcrR family transcriptional regulator [Desulfosporosinus hippei]|uniref:DNA-binding transcriptional regulator, AcrR family n=1 Tax=Desulfosporosinus hippei DSM 8344 TaxID=1121419 RepID=A0A1G8IAK5_9FIRM|nr:TetR/AcrR family transcriptional regulator [Desulfosporosinus hippei]SDI15781.1 DNA-binding transcriptional regulator, AcrR family [Desulfosporosinus hippei DSM 8344]